LGFAQATMFLEPSMTVASSHDPPALALDREAVAGYVYEHGRPEPRGERQHLRDRPALPMYWIRLWLPLDQRTHADVGSHPSEGAHRDGVPWCREWGVVHRTDAIRDLVERA
jgi:hypothetical protein